ncbi:MAG: diguanylate cyclase, partial [Pseudomonadota bacterium]|nr:diguanylate cyclase [Pseudomonadota bacterium]
MSLSRQITLILLCASSVLLLALGWTMFDQTRAALGARQQVLAREVAQALAKSLATLPPAPIVVASEAASEPVSTQPAPSADPQIDSRLDLAFDSADLQEITLRRADQTILAQRRAMPPPGEVPAWFVRLSALTPPTMHATWSRADSGPVDIAVVAASTDVLSAWWQAVRQTAMVAAAALLLVLLLGALWLVAILRPLRALGAQARAISDREYPVTEVLPRDPDLRSLAQALNRLSGKMRSLFDAHTEAMNRLRAESYRDVLTGLANRRYFDLRLQQLLGAADGANSGALLLIALDDFQGINLRLGFAAGDELLRTAANALELCAREAPEFEHFVARLSGATFALLLSNAAEQDAAACAQRLVTAWGRLHLPMPLMGQAPTRGLGHIGIAMVRHQSATQLLAEADTALRAAQGKGPDAWHLHDPRGDRSVEYSA